jgi:hypothetical protein
MIAPNPNFNWMRFGGNALQDIGVGLTQSPTVFGGLARGAQLSQANQPYRDQQAALEEEQKRAALERNQTSEWIKANFPQYSNLPTDQAWQAAMGDLQAQRSAANGGSDELWGLTPQAYEVPGPDGKPSIQIGVMSNKGNFKPVPLPENANPVFPVQQLNTGTQFKGVDKFGRGTGGAIAIDNAGKSFAEGVGGGAAKSFQKYQDDAQGAYATLGQLSVMQNAMNDPNFYSGIGADAVQNFKRVIVALGGDPNSVSSMETFGAAANKVVLDGIGGSLGAQISNSDRSFIQNTAPNLGNTPEGNRQLIEIATKLANRKIEVAQLAAQYVQENGSLDANWPVYLAQWAEARPLFGGAPAGGPPAAAAPVVDMGGGITIQEVP